MLLQLRAQTVKEAGLQSVVESLHLNLEGGGGGGVVVPLKPRLLGLPPTPQPQAVLLVVPLVNAMRVMTCTAKHSC